jgi:hypothetical protein
MVRRHHAEPVLALPEDLLKYGDSSLSGWHRRTGTLRGLGGGAPQDMTLGRVGGKEVTAVDRVSVETITGGTNVITG